MKRSGIIHFQRFLVVHIFLNEVYRVDPQMISYHVMQSICKQRADFALTSSLQAPMKKTPSEKVPSLVQCGWFNKKEKSFSLSCTRPKTGESSNSEGTAGI